MKALEYVLVQSRKLEIREHSIKWPPNQGSRILCKTVVSGISPGTEIAAWRGEKPLRSTGGFPRKLGYQNIATVLDTSGTKGNIKVGDLVYTNQSHCSYFDCSESEILSLVPETSDLKRLVFAYLYHLSLCALSVGAVSKEEKKNNCYIFGGGTIASSLVEICISLGYRIKVISDSKKIFETFGNAITMVTRKDFNEVNNDGKSTCEQIVITSNRWEDYESALKAIGDRGIIVILGFPGRDGTLPKINPFDPGFFYVKNLSVHSLPDKRKNLYQEGEEVLSLSLSVEEIIRLMLIGKIGKTFEHVPIFEFKDLHLAYDKLEKENRPNSVALDWTSI